MSDFMRDLEKVTPKQQEQDIKKEIDNPGISSDDVKAYFTAMKESLMQDLKKEMQDLLNSASPNKKDEEHIEQKEEKEEDK